MDKCGQACPYNTLDGCKVKEYSAICPLTNMATPIAECKMTNYVGHNGFGDWLRQPVKDGEDDG